MTKKKRYQIQTRGTQDTVARRRVLYDLFGRRPMPDDELLINLGLYMRSGALAKLLFLDEVYRRIVPIPGCIIEFGTWWGQSLAVFENLRAVHEPYNFSRRVIGFDSFAGYTRIGNKDKASETIKSGGYKTSEGYEKYLDELLAYHESENVMGHIRKHEIVKGDVTKTVKPYFDSHPEMLVALAFFDLALYEPTRAALRSLLPRMVKGSIIVFDELNSAEYPGETVAMIEELGVRQFELLRSMILPDRSYMIIA